MQAFNAPRQPLAVGRFCFVAYSRFVAVRRPCACNSLMRATVGFALERDEPAVEADRESGSRLALRSLVFHCRTNAPSLMQIIRLESVRADWYSHVGRSRHD